VAPFQEGNKFALQAKISGNGFLDRIQNMNSQSNLFTGSNKIKMMGGTK